MIGQFAPDILKSLTKSEPVEDAVLKETKELYTEAFKRNIHNQMTMSDLAVKEMEARIANMSKKSLWET
jgi:hypothetical protein